jgi:hypothetical protein
MTHGAREILVYTHTSGRQAYGIEGLGTAVTPEGRAFNLSEAWSPEESVQPSELPSGARAALLARLDALQAQEEARIARELAIAEARRSREEAYRAWYDSPEQVLARAREARAWEAFLRGMRRMLASL